MLQIVFHQTQIQGGMYLSMNKLYQTVQIPVKFFYSLVQQITQKIDAVKLKCLFTLGMKRLISHVRLLFNIQRVHLFSNTFKAACYNMHINMLNSVIKSVIGICLF